MTLVRLTRETFVAFNEDKAQRLAAALAFSTIFAVAPLFVILIAVVGGVLSLDGSGGHTRKIALFPRSRRMPAPQRPIPSGS
jgi:uncharacterized BrkB/YihY/UPF0761 family membrane protein